MDYRGFTKKQWKEAYRAARLGNQPHPPVRMVLKHFARTLRSQVA